MIYCINCEKQTQEHPFDGGMYHLKTVINGSNPFDVGSYYDIEECPYPYGWATCPPPPFDMDEYMEDVEEPPFQIVDILGYDYDSETDQIIYEDYTV